MREVSTLVEKNDLELVSASLRGDQKAFARLMIVYHDKVFNVVYRMCGDPELAQDATQDAFVRAWQNLHKYNPEQPLRNWLFRIATNAAIDRLRQTKPVEDIEKLTLHSKEWNPEEALEAREKAELIRQAILSLPNASRSVLVLREYEGLSYQEIADTLQIPVGTVMSRLNFARNHLRGSLKTLMEAG